ncbi:Crp/Fnr family transcriptional regulator [Arenibacter echinorum]|uniref:CRP-like cAMP-binding protein n=1 Tax=Arenibacter echinorum TaxID=440515 RepID=A0A327R5Y3_9FLAO|nr:Crp/Fnr family transcriptional regulator [Arenibacter echinorum]RAJ12249.1 CRP-like cAMP-binding protein [Arenibacter echinorum]
MDPQYQIASYIQRFISLTEEEASHFSSKFKVVKVRKKQFIVQPNFTAKKRFYVVEGALRSFVVNKSGQETTIALAINDWWITDYNSYIFQQPATMFVEALESSTLLELDFEKEQDLKKSNPKFETFFRIIAERGLASQQRRITMNLTKSAEERYTYFTEKYPQFLQHIPQYALASYLGMTTEFLSKIRNNKVKGKS